MGYKPGLIRDVCDLAYVLILEEVKVETAADQALWIAAKQGAGEEWTEPWPTRMQAQVDLDERLDAEPDEVNSEQDKFRRLLGMM